VCTSPRTHLELVVIDGFMLLAYAITDTDESIRVARDWIATNAGTTGPGLGLGSAVGGRR
jgi:hypothetical protein